MGNIFHTRAAYAAVTVVKGRCNDTDESTLEKSPDIVQSYSKKKEMMLLNIRGKKE